MPEFNSQDPNATLAVEKDHVLGQDRFPGQGSFYKIATQDFSNHVLGQNRFLGQGSFYKIATQNCSNHVPGDAFRNQRQDSVSIPSN